VFSLTVSLILSLSPVADSTTLEAILQKADRGKWAEQEVGDRVARVAIEFLGTPYVGGTLDTDPKSEVCTVLFDGLDCVTFAETSLAIARALREKKSPTLQDIISQVTFTRYRGGKVDGYVSRLHYTSDWILDGVAKKSVVNLADGHKLSKPWPNSIGFMTTNADKYPALNANAELVPRLRKWEEALEKAHKPYFSPDVVPKIESELRSGDIIAFTDARKGLDCAHVGVVYMEKGKPRVLHASSTKKKVIRDGSPSEMLANSSRFTGIMVARPIERPSR
jgi:hypothetical protein